MSVGRMRDPYHNRRVSSTKRFSISWPLILVVLTWGFNFVSLKILYREMEPPAAMLLRFATMWALLIPVCKLRGLSLVYVAKDAVRILISGFISMGLYMVLFMEGLHMTSPAEGAIILASSPVMTYLMATALKQERFSAPALIGSSIAFAGVAMVILGGTSADGATMKGNLIMLASSVVWAYCVVYMKPLLNRYDATQLLALSMPGGALLMVPYGLASLVHTNFRGVSPLGWMMFLQVSVLSGVIGFGCFYVGIKQVGASRATLYQYFVPPAAALFAWIVMGRTLAPIQMVGLVILLFGVFATTKARIAIQPRREVVSEAAT